MPNTADDLADALAAAVGGRFPDGELSSATAVLIERYQARRAAPPGQPILQTARDVAAYAMYRMPATYAAVRAALEQAAWSLGEFRPLSQLDVGSGTGAALWAADAVWDSIRDRSAHEGVPEAIELGRAIAAADPGLKGTNWVRSELTGAAEYPEADLGTAAYVLGELSPDAQRGLVQALTRAATAVAVVEPGTVYGYRNVLRARTQLIDAGWHIAAPCPQELACPLADGDDWCHFSARLPRLGSHRRLKGAALSYEDEKFAYVVAARLPIEPVPNRVIRHPRYRKGLVSLDLCLGDGSQAETRLVTKRQGELYRAGRDVRWGEAWPPPEP